MGRSTVGETAIHADSRPPYKDLKDLRNAVLVYDGSSTGADNLSESALPDPKIEVWRGSSTEELHQKIVKRENAAPASRKLASSLTGPENTTVRVSDMIRKPLIAPIDPTPGWVQLAEKMGRVALLSRHAVKLP